MAFTNTRGIDPRSKNTLTVGPWTRGLNTANPSYEIGADELSLAENIDLDRLGKIRSIREGYQTRVQTTNAHSLFSNGKFLFFCDNGWLCSLDSTSYAVYQITPVNAQRPLSFVDINGVVYWSNGEQSGRLFSGQLFDGGIPESVTSQPCVRVVDGNLPSGMYQVAVTFVNAGGEESGTCAPRLITLTGTSGIECFDIPSPVGSTSVRVYLSATNGEELFLQKQSDIRSSVTITDFTYGLRIKTLLLDKFPQCDILQYFSGRLFGAKGSVLYFSEALQYELCHLVNNFIPFEDEITLIAPTNDGMYIGTKDKTWFVSGTEPKEFKVVTDYPYGALRGTLQTVACSLLGMTDALGTVPFWYSTLGAVLGLQGGIIKPIHENRVAVEGFSHGSTLLKVKNGTNQLITSLKKTHSPHSHLAAKEEVIITVRRNGIII
jgi:hypothetical protein